MTIKPLRIALFIDAENTSPKYIGQAIAYCNEIGRISVRRVYGNAEALARWSKIAAEHCILPMQTPPSASKQNASDFALTLDAASLLHRGLFDHAVIMSSDADFTQLAMHIREYGVPVSGLGEAKTPKSLQSAFDAFVLLEEKASTKTRAVKPNAAAAAKMKPSPPASAKAAWTGLDPTALLKIYEDLKDGDEAVTVAAMGSHLAKLQPHYKKGFKTTSNYLSKSGLFTVTGRTLSRNSR